MAHEFSTAAFRQFLVDEVKSIQKEELGPYQKGALDCLARVTIGFEQLVQEAYASTEDEAEG